MENNKTFEFSFFYKCEQFTNTQTGETYWKWDNKVKHAKYTWTDLVELLSEHKQVNQKPEAELISPTVHYSPNDSGTKLVPHSLPPATRKCADTAKEISFLVLDIEPSDDAGSIDDFIAKNTSFEYLLATSFYHKTEKYDYKDRYRVFIPIENSLSIPEYKALRPALINRFPIVDKTCFDIAHAFFFPSCAPSSIDNARVYHNKSDNWFNPLELKQELKELTNNRKIKFSTENLERNFLLKTFRIVDFFTEKGLYRQHLGGNKHLVTCPNHSNHTTQNEHFDTSTVIYEDPGFKCFHTHCQHSTSSLQWLVDFFGPDEISKYCDPKKENLNPDIPANKEFVKPSYTKIKQTLAKAVDDIYHQQKNGNQSNNYCIYAAEGTGKSHSALEFWKTGKTVIFLTKSYKQAHAKYDEFNQLDTKPILVQSKDEQFRKQTGCKIERNKSYHPFRAGEINYNKTIKTAQTTAKHRKKTKKLLEHHLKACLIDDSIEKHLSHTKKFIIATFSQMRKLCNKGIELSKNVVVFIDDPDFLDVIHLHPYDKKLHRPQKFNSTPANSPKPDMVSIHGKTYFSRSKGMAPNQNKCIVVYTTTELCIKKYLSSIEVNIIDLMESLDAGKITLLGTKVTHRKRDAQLSIFVEQLRKNGHQIQFIANGVGSELNLTNSKGLNDLSNKNIIVKISQPPETLIATYIAALNLGNFSKNSTEWREITLILMFDMLNQALGRAAGYRWKDGSDIEIIALIDPAYHSYLISHTRYILDKKYSVLIDWLADSAKSRLPRGASELLQQLDYYINSKEYPNSSDYNDSKNTVLKSITDKEKYLERLAKAEAISETNSSGIALFISNKCVNTGEIKLKVFKKAFQEWQRFYHKKTIKHSELKNELEQMGYDINNDNRNKTYFIYGLSLNEGVATPS